MSFAQSDRINCRSNTGNKFLLSVQPWLSGKESACNAGDSSLTTELGRSPGEGTSYQLQCSWALLVMQTVKNLPAMWETWVLSLGWEDPLEKGWQPTPIFLPKESPWTDQPGRLQSMGSQRVREDWETEHTHLSNVNPLHPCHISCCHSRRRNLPGINTRYSCTGKNR